MNVKLRMRLAVLALVWIACMALMPARAANLAVDPVRVELSPDQATAAINIRNDSDQPTSLQIQALAWSQVDGKDVYTPTRELLVSPPIVTLAPKSEQVIRTALRRSADAATELTYRIYLQELPPPPTPGVVALQVALRIGLPVFVKPQTGKAAPNMNWRILRAGESELRVILRNHGTAHVQVSDFALYASSAQPAVAGESSSSYVLAGQTREWLLKIERSTKITGGQLRLKAYTDAGNVDTELPLDQP
jgi:fimbrial chaperone protein